MLLVSTRRLLVLFTTLLGLSIIFPIGLALLPNQMQVEAAVDCPAVPKASLGAPLDRSHLTEYSQLLEQINQQLVVLTDAYSRAPESQRTDYIPVLQQVLAFRKPILVQVMRLDPSNTFGYLLSEQHTAILSVIAPGCIEKLNTAEGTLAVYHADYFSSRTSHTSYRLTTTGETIDLHQVAPHTKPLLSGMQVNVNGYQLDSDMVFAPGQLRVLAEAPTDTIGVQSTVVIMANFQNTPLPNLSQAQMQDIVFNQTNNYYQEVSFAKTSLTGIVLDWRTLPINATCDLDVVRDAAINAVDAQVNFTQYGRLILTFPFVDCPGSGFGTVGKVAVTTADGVVQMSVSWDGANYMELDLVAHELGHNFGTLHANFLDCGSVVIKPNINDCTHVEYGDIYDVMGFGGPTGHMNAVHKDYLNWFNPANVITVTVSGTYIIEPLETISQGSKALKIPRTGGDFLYVEYRQPIGADARLLSLGSDVFDGALIHQGTFGPHLLDTSPPSNNLTPALKVGQSMTDPVTNTQIRVVSKTDSALTVTVSLAGCKPRPACFNAQRACKIREPAEGWCQ